MCLDSFEIEKRSVCVSDVCQVNENRLYINIPICMPAYEICVSNVIHHQFIN